MFEQEKQLFRAGALSVLPDGGTRGAWPTTTRRIGGWQCQRRSELLDGARPQCGSGGPCGQL